MWMLKIWKLLLWEMSGVIDTLGHTLLCKSLSTKDFWERETVRLVPRDNFVNATNNINVLVLHICLRTNLHAAHTACFNRSLRTSHRTPLASLSKIFFFREIKRGRGNSSSNNWLSVRLGLTNVFKQYDAFFWHALEFNSMNVANRLLHGGFIISFMKFIIILIFTMTDLSANSDVIMIHSKIRWELKFPHFWISFLDLSTIHQLQLHRQLIDFNI